MKRRPAPKPNDSSVGRARRAPAKESRFFKGAGGVRVLGRVEGHGAPRRALAAALGLYQEALGLGRAGLTLMLVDDRDMRGLNRRFRGKDKATDVLSFPAESRPPRPGSEAYLGDLALCPTYAWAKRGRFDPDFGAEAAFLVLHGLLHLSGRHHDNPSQERAMFRLSARLHPLARPTFAALRRLRPLKARKGTRLA